MKYSLSLVATYVLLSIGHVGEAVAVEEINNTSHSYPVAGDSPRLVIENIWGGIKVSTHSKSEIIVSIKEKYSAPTQELLEKSKTVFALHTDTDNQSLSLVVGDQHNNRNDGDHCRKCRADFQFDVLVPVNANVDLRTVMDGKIVVEKVRGLIKAVNVNEAVMLTDITQCSEVTTVNNRIDVTFQNVPKRGCDIKTINGDVVISLPERVDIDVAFDMLNGRMHSEFDVNSLNRPGIVEHEEINGRNLYEEFFEKNSATCPCIE